MSSEKGNGIQPTYREMEAKAAESGHGQDRRDEGMVIRETIRNVVRDDDVDKEVRKYFSGDGAITGVGLFDVHHALLVVIEADSSGMLSKVAQKPGGEGRIYKQMRAVYGKFYDIRGSSLRTARLSYQPEAVSEQSS